MGDCIPDRSGVSVAWVPEPSEITPDTSDRRDAPPKPPPLGRFDPEPARERLRGRIAVILILLFVAEIACFAAFFWLDHGSSDASRFSDLKDFMGLILTPTVALVGAATGFYFGGRGTGG